MDSDDDLIVGQDLHESHVEGLCDCHSECSAWSDWSIDRAVDDAQYDDDLHDDRIQQLLADEAQSVQRALEHFASNTQLGLPLCDVYFDEEFDFLDDFDEDDQDFSSKAIRDQAAWNSQCIEATHKYRLSTKERRHWRPTEAMSPNKKKIKVEEDALDLAATLPLIRTSARPTTLRQAWQQKHHEAVVRLASSLIEQRASAIAHYNIDGIRELCAALRHRFLGYEAMGLSTLAVADAKRILELTGRFGGDVDVEVDEDLLPVLASIDTIANPSDTIVPSDGVDLHRGLKRSANDTLGGSLLKRTNAGTETPMRKSTGIIQLPVEVILMIAEFLPTPDRIKLANTRYDWRSISELWRSLEFVRIKGTASLNKGWQRDTIDACVTAIQTCQRRSHNQLASVVLKGFLPSGTVGHIPDVLQPSSNTLRYLAIPTSDQKQCFTQLYKRSSNLSGIDIRVNFDGEVRGEINGTSLFCGGKLPFKLKTFISTQMIDCGDIAPHMAGIEVVQGVKYLRQKQLNFIDGIVRAAPTLIEWRDDVDDKWDFSRVVLGDYGVGTEQLPKDAIVFPKMRKLSALWAEHFIECVFPVLEEARLNANRGHYSLGSAASDVQSRVATIILKSPLLKKLDILLPPSATEQRQIFAAISELPNLEELGLWSSGTLSLSGLVEIHKSGDDRDTFLVLPSLHTLRLCSRLHQGNAGRIMDKEMCEMLLLRSYLKRGCRFANAKTRADAAILAYEVSGSYPGMSKTQRKKAINASADAAIKSGYKGDYTTMADGSKRENFKAILPNLVVTRSMFKSLDDSPSLIKQLVGRLVEVDATKNFEAFSGNHSHYY
ncbi:hypothetical protein EX895_006387 [Sporisorium graminicola]|uniref:F-box domain-containing protein n=1 Tax=Sporisorium graminicola TaxID=280036 RepID=A0A4U7KL45_9BASI|nr:hypothetical protein EX895_006387 [Sporisorium graminicola]TKY84486.1 hypothetical protein EX895_006387 [Sporisorium graminicola]